jgi:uncharacterized cupin superfamily protein
VHLTVKLGGAVTGEAVHPAIEERFEVLSGRLGTPLAGVERTLWERDSVTAPAGAAHDWCNDGDADAEVLVEVSPPDPCFEAMIANHPELERPHGHTSPDPEVLARAGLAAPHPATA